MSNPQIIGGEMPLQIISHGMVPSNKPKNHLKITEFPLLWNFQQFMFWAAAGFMRLLIVFIAII